MPNHVGLSVAGLVASSQQKPPTGVKTLSAAGDYAHYLSALAPALNETKAIRDNLLKCLIRVDYAVCSLGKSGTELEFYPMPGCTVEVLSIGPCSHTCDADSLVSA